MLGAPLFITYINDIERVWENCHIVLYADEASIFTEAAAEELCYENLDKKIDNINKWLKMK